jgi:drug/metabolite transporter (DMT)-like permease
MRFTERQLAALALSLSSLAWASNAIVGRVVRLDLDPVMLSFWRWLITAVILACLGYKDFRRDATLYRRHWRFILFGGVTGMAVFHTLQYQALGLTSAINVTLMTCFTPSIVAVSSMIWTGEIPKARQTCGIVFSTVGTVLIIAHGSFATLAGLRIEAGEAVMCCAVVCWAVYTIAIRQRPVELSSRSTLFAMASLASILLAPAYIWELGNGRGMVGSLSNVAVVAYLGVAASFVAYSAHSYGMQRIGATAGSQYLCLIPVFASAMSYFFLAEPVMPHQILALFLIVGGIYLGTMPAGRLAGTDAGSRNA